MAEDETSKPDPAHLARFRKVMTALVAVPKDEAFREFLKKEMKTPKRLDSKGRIVDVTPTKGKTQKEALTPWRQIQVFLP
jgi:hypothetical protein